MPPPLPRRELGPRHLLGDLQGLGGVELKNTPAGRPIVRMGRPSKVTPKVETELVTFRTDKREKEALEALAEAQGRTLSELLRVVTHDLVSTFKAGQKTARVRA